MSSRQLTPLLQPKSASDAHSPLFATTSTDMTHAISMHVGNLRVSASLISCMLF